MHPSLRFAAVLALLGQAYGDPICCTPDQWEALMFWDNGNAFVDAQNLLESDPRVGSAISYINASLVAAYDYTNGRTYIQVPATEISPQIPKPVVDNTTLIRDYKNVSLYSQLFYTKLTMHLMQHD